MSELWRDEKLAASAPSPLTHCGPAAMMDQPSETAAHYRRFQEAVQ
jgi:hypothetical protein